MPFVVQRGLSRRALASVLELERTGTRCCNRIEATIRAQDRAKTIRALAEAGVPVPATRPAATWDEVLAIADHLPVVVKASVESSGRGRGVIVTATGRLSLAAPFAGPYLVQAFIAGDARVRKIYVVGDQTRGLLKQQPRDDRQVFAVPFVIDGALAEIALRVGHVMDLEIFGVDVLIGTDRPVVVDVNPFPGFRGVAAAAQMLTQYLTSAAGDAPVAADDGPS